MASNPNTTDQELEKEKKRQQEASGIADQDRVALETLQGYFADDFSEYLKLQNKSFPNGFEGVREKIKMKLHAISEIVSGIMIPWKKGSVKDTYCKELWKALDILRKILLDDNYKAICKHAIIPIAKSIPALRTIINDILNQKAINSDIHREFHILLALTKFYENEENFNTIQFYVHHVIQIGVPKTRTEMCAILRCLQVAGEVFVQCMEHIEPRPDGCQSIILLRNTLVHLFDQGTIEQQRVVSEVINLSHKLNPLIIEIIKSDLPKILANVQHLLYHYAGNMSKTMGTVDWWNKSNGDPIYPDFLFPLFNAIQDQWQLNHISALASALSEISPILSKGAQKKSTEHADKGDKKSLNAGDKGDAKSSAENAANEEKLQAEEQGVFHQFALNTLQQLFAEIKLLREILLENTKNPLIENFAMEYFGITIGSICKRLMKNVPFTRSVTGNYMTQIMALGDQRDTLGHNPSYLRARPVFTGKDLIRLETLFQIVEVRIKFDLLQEKLSQIQQKIAKEKTELFHRVEGEITEINRRILVEKDKFRELLVQLSHTTLVEKWNRVCQEYQNASASKDFSNEAQLIRNRMQAEIKELLDILERLKQEVRDISDPLQIFHADIEELTQLLSEKEKFIHTLGARKGAILKRDINIQVLAYQAACRKFLKATEPISVQINQKALQPPAQNTSAPKNP